MSISSHLLLLVSTVLLAAGPAASQVTTAELAGAVTDSTGGIVATARVTLSSPDTGFSREVPTDAAGTYIMTLLPPGTYSLTVEAPGFRRLVQSGIVLQVNQRARVDLTLQVGQVTEVVEVMASAALLESQSSAVGNVISQQFVSELPLNGRNFVQLAILTPGVNGTGFSVSGTIMS